MCPALTHAWQTAMFWKQNKLADAGLALLVGPEPGQGSVFWDGFMPNCI